MSDPKSNDETTQQAELADIQPEVQELGAEDAENVAGGILIGLSQPTLQYKELPTGSQTGFVDGSVFTGVKYGG